jgi:hypothetical protein
MPFTLSHLAAVLPAHRQLRRRGLLSAAIVGSMVPDFGFLLPLHLTRAQTHSAAALFSFCLPVGLVSWWCFQLLIKPAWCAVMPGRWRRRLRAEHPVARIGQWRVWLAGALAILAGAMTHLVWDGFTHEGGHGVQMLPFLDAYYSPEPGGLELPLYRWLQHGSSVIGLIIVIAVTWRWTRGGGALAERPGVPELPAVERHLWIWIYLMLPISTLGLAVLTGWRHMHSPLELREQASRLAVLSLDGTALSLLLVSALVRLRVRATAQRRLDG